MIVNKKKKGRIKIRTIFIIVININTWLIIDDNDNNDKN